MERTISVTDAARHFSELIDRTYYRHEVTLLVRSGMPVARVVPVVPTAVTGRTLAERLHELGHLTREEAGELQKDIEASRAKLNRPPESHDLGHNS